MDVIGQIFAVLEILFSETVFTTFGIIIIALFANVVIRLTERRTMRPITAFDTVQAMTGASIESSRPLHISIGSATIGDETTLLALLSSEFLYYASREVAIGEEPPLFTVSEGVALPLAVDTLSRAYEHENRTEVLNITNPVNWQDISVRWYPAGKRSLAFASALMTIQADDNLSGNVLAGRYGLELALILDSAHRNKRPSVASSDMLDGQAIAYALADDTLIGEEIFAAPAYVSDNLSLQKRNFIIDLMRGLVVVAIIGLTLYNIVAGG
ncbi:MAG: hypothetical protein Phog2KO_41720 [Phototrophicaceae bacterium]